MRADPCEEARKEGVSKKGVPARAPGASAAVRGAHVSQGEACVSIPAVFIDWLEAAHGTPDLGECGGGFGAQRLPASQFLSISSVECFLVATTNTASSSGALSSSLI